MATLTPTLTLTSTDATSDELNITITDSLTTTNPAVNTAKISVATSATNILATTDTSDAYVYLRNTDSTNFVTVYTDAAVAFGELLPGEFAFFPLKGAVGLELIADTAACIVEYGYWSRA